MGIAIAAVFALCHLPKAGITGLQIGVIFVMGVVYSWLRIKSNSTTSPFLALKGGPGVAPNLPVELPHDFAAISLVLEQPLFIGASHKSGINSIADLIAH